MAGPLQQAFPVEAAERLFVALVERNGLSYRVERPPSVDLVVSVPAQARLSFAMHLVMQNADELCIQLDDFSADYFPCTDLAVRAEFEAAVQGLIGGRCRVLVQRRSAPFGMVTSYLQLREGEAWTNLRSYRRLGLPLGPVATTVLHNDRGDRAATA